jgi:membrane protease YdiL (CAAX protease family)
MSPAHRLALLAAVALAPAYLNDLLYMQAESVFDWLAADYGSKILIVALILLIPDTRQAIAGTWNGAELRRRDWVGTAAWTLAVAGLTVTAFIHLKPPLDALAPGMALFDYPDIDDAAVRVFDLTAGLVLTAVAEELGFRALVGRVLERLGAGVVANVLLSALLFSLIHWSNGLGSLGVTFVAGVLLAALYMRSRSLWPAVAAHYLADLVLFL